MAASFSLVSKAPHTAILFVHIVFAVYFSITDPVNGDAGPVSTGVFVMLASVVGRGKAQDT